MLGSSDFFSAFSIVMMKYAVFLKVLITSWKRFSLTYLPLGLGTSGQFCRLCFLCFCFLLAKSTYGVGIITHLVVRFGLGHGCHGFYYGIASFSDKLSMFSGLTSILAGCRLSSQCWALFFPLLHFLFSLFFASISYWTRAFKGFFFIVA